MKKSYEELLATAIARAEKAETQLGLIQALLDRAYAEIRKQTFGSRVVFDREIVEKADGAGDLD